MSKKDTDQLVKKLIRTPGVVIKEGGTGHHKVYFHGRLITTIAKTASEPRGMKNAISTLRKAGVL